MQNARPRLPHRPPVDTRPARRAPPAIRRYSSAVVAELAQKTRYVNPALAAEWSAIVGSELAGLCRPGRLSGGRIGRSLELICPSGAAAARVAFETEGVRRKVNMFLGPGAVGKISVRQSGVKDEGGARLSSVLARFRSAVSARRGGDPP